MCPIACINGERQWERGNLSRVFYSRKIVDAIPERESRYVRCAREKRSPGSRSFGGACVNDTPGRNFPSIIGEHADLRSLRLYRGTARETMTVISAAVGCLLPRSASRLGEPTREKTVFTNSNRRVNVTNT